MFTKVLFNKIHLFYLKCFLFFFSFWQSNNNFQMDLKKLHTYKILLCFIVDIHRGGK